jgi:glycosyltransferase involved in cell wall biosynthesis
MIKLYKLLYILWSLKNHKNREKFLVMLHEYLQALSNPPQFLSSPPNKLSDIKTPYTVEIRTLGVNAKILLVVHQFSRTGAPYAVLYLARALFSLYGIRPVVISPQDGPIREEFEQEGFATVVDPLLFSYQNYSPEACDFVASFERVIVSSLVCHGFVNYFRGMAKHLTWWLHETEQGFHSATETTVNLPLFFASCESVWLCSPLCFPIALQYTSQDKLHLLLYGRPDTAIPHRPHQSGKMVFSIVGSVEPRKGQDIFLNAIECLPEELRCKAIFRIIGSPLPSDESLLFYQEIRTKAEQLPEIECFENMSPDKLLAFYAETNVVVSASRDDPMPIVITEGLMFSRVCLCSSAIGHAKLLVHKKDGLVFTNESAEQLAENMAWILQNPSELTAIGVAGRQLYEKHFLMDSFANNVANLVQDR